MNAQSLSDGKSKAVGDKTRRANPKRLMRNTVVVTVFCAAMFGAYLLLRLMGLTAFGDQNSMFSDARLAADKSFKQKQWDKAEKHYAEMLEADPYNPTARFRASYSMQKQYYEGKKRSSQLTASEKKELDLLCERAIDSYTKALDFPMFARIAHYNLACLYAVSGDRDNAIKHLRTIIKRGYLTRDGITEDEDFASLLSDPEFIELSLHEKEVRRQRSLGNSRYGQ